MQASTADLINLERFSETTSSSEGGSSNVVVDQPNGDNLGWKIWKKRRIMFVAMIFIGTICAYFLRVNLSIAIIAMTEKTNESTVVEFEWDSRTIGLLLSGFYYGYLTTQVLAGCLVSEVKPVWMLGFAIGGTSFVTLMTAPAARAGWFWLMLLRTIEGGLQGLIYPTVHAMWPKWTPIGERNRLASIAFSGHLCGTIITFPLAACINNLIGWEWIFYISAISGLLWTVLWIVCGAGTPEEDKWIHQSELNYIHLTRGCVKKNNVPITWAILKGLFRSPALWAIAICCFSESWGFYTMLTQLPIYMKDVLHYDIKGAGFVSSVPYIAMVISMQVAGQAADYLQKQNLMSLTMLRKMFICPTFLIQAGLMCITGYMISPAGAIICLTITAFVGPINSSAYFINIIDIAPDYAGIVMGFCNTVGTIAGVISPIATGYIVTNKCQEEWRMVYAICAGIYVFGTIVYGALGSAKLIKLDTKNTENKTTVNQAIETQV